MHSRLSGMAVLLLAGCGAVHATKIDVTSDSVATLKTGKTLIVDFGVWNYGVRNPDTSPYPTSLGFSAVGLIPEGASAEAVPGSSQTAFPAYLMQAFLESLDGSISVPFHDPLAVRLGFGTGYIVAVPGIFSASGTPISVAAFQGSVSLPIELSESLFGSNIGNYNDAARIRLVNRGEAFAFGIGDPYRISQTITVPGVRGLGDAQTSGITGAVTIYNPEPSTMLLLVLPLAGVWWCQRRRTRK